MGYRAPGESWEWGQWVNGHPLSALLTFLSCLWSCVHMYRSCSSQHRECFGCIECFSCSHARRILANPQCLPWCPWWQGSTRAQEMAAQRDVGTTHVAREGSERVPCSVEDWAQLYPPSTLASSCPSLWPHPLHVPLQRVSPGEAAQLTAPAPSWDLPLTQRSGLAEPCLTTLSWEVEAQLSSSGFSLLEYEVKMESSRDQDLLELSLISDSVLEQ